MPQVQREHKKSELLEDCLSWYQVDFMHGNALKAPQRNGGGYRSPLNITCTRWIETCAPTSTVQMEARNVDVCWWQLMSINSEDPRQWILILVEGGCPS